MKLLKEYIEDDMLVREYTKDGKMVSHVVKTPAKKETEGEVIELPKNPILELQKENENLKKQLATCQQSIVELTALANTVAVPKL